MNFLPGDILRLSTPESDPPWSAEVTIKEIHWSADAEGNSISGSIIDGSQAGEMAFRLSQPQVTPFFPSMLEGGARSVDSDEFYVPSDGALMCAPGRM
jgi:hypothetical protein